MNSRTISNDQIIHNQMRERSVGIGTQFDFGTNQRNISPSAHNFGAKLKFSMVDRDIFNVSNKRKGRDGKRGQRDIPPSAHYFVKFSMVKRRGRGEEVNQILLKFKTNYFETERCSKKIEKDTDPKDFKISIKK